MSSAVIPAIAAGTSVEISNLTLRIGDRTLLEDAAACFQAGEVTLIVGQSGAGKSLLLRVLAGLLDPDAADIRAGGSVRIGEHETLPGPGIRAVHRAPVGVVFQNFALFDELSPLENVRLAAAHRAICRARAAVEFSPEALLDELQVPRNVRTASLSGGQRQRLAIARTLAYNPAVILYDEPTSGLDVCTAERVAGLIGSTHATHPQTSIIVTHDYAALAPIADRIYLLDPSEKCLREVQREDWGRLHELLEGGESAKPQAVASTYDLPLTTHDSPFTRIASFLAGTSKWLEQVVSLPIRLLPLWKSPAWGFRYLWHYLKLVANPSAWLYLAIAGVIAGFVATYFTFRFLPYRQYTEPLIIENLLDALGFALYRILVPVLGTVLIAARCGAAVASDIGGKVYGQQMDALRSFGVAPQRYLQTGILYAFLIGTPLLIGIGFVAARWTSLAVFAATHPELGAFFWQSHFHQSLQVPGQWWYQGTGWLLAKTLCCAAGMSLFAWQRGRTPKYSTGDVSAGITSNILWSTLYVLAVHFTFAFYEFE